MLHLHLYKLFRFAYFQQKHMLSQKDGEIFQSCLLGILIQPHRALSMSSCQNLRKELSGQRSCHPAQVFGVRQDSASAFLLMDRLLTCDWTNEEIRVAGGDAESGVVDHPLKLKSSYVALAGSAEARDLTGEPRATSYHLKFIGTVDYIWYTEGLEPVRVLDVPPFEKLRRTGGLPCKKVGSDHLALVSEFAFTQVRNAFNNLPLSHQ